MAEGFKKAAVWLGLMADTPYPDDDRPDAEATAAVSVREPDHAPVRERHLASLEQPEASVTPLERRRPTPVKADLSRIVTVHPRTYNEARTIGEHFRDGTPVIMNLTDMEDADAKRLVDFAAGLIFGLPGSI